jgi:hypothetical protein
MRPFSLQFRKLEAITLAWKLELVMSLPQILHGHNGPTQDETFQPLARNLYNFTLKTQGIQSWYLKLISQQEIVLKHGEVDLESFLRTRDGIRSLNIYMIVKG